MRYVKNSATLLMLLILMLVSVLFIGAGAIFFGIWFSEHSSPQEAQIAILAAYGASFVFALLYYSPLRGRFRTICGLISSLCFGFALPIAMGHSNLATINFIGLAGLLTIHGVLGWLRDKRLKVQATIAPDELR
jgi:hypothetical protein